MRKGGFAITIASSVVFTTALASSCRPRVSDKAALAKDAPPLSPSLTGSEAANAGEETPGGARTLAHGEGSATTTVGPGMPVSGPWVSFYGTAAEMGDLAKVARTYRIINVDADPGSGNFTTEQLQQLRARGANRLLSYFNVGACEHYRTYWSSAPPGFTSCSAARSAQRGAYDGYPDETWMDPGDPAYQRLLLEYVAPRLAARVDGFYLDNLELLEHPAMSSNGPCSASCRQGGLDFVRKLREKFPGHLVIMQNATSDVTRNGITGGLRYARLLDGVAHEEVYAPKHDASAEAELLAWKAMGLTSRAGHPFWIAVEDYAGSCSNRAAAQAAHAKARAHGFSSYVSDESGGQKTVCYWQ